jgi:hypothetical protein
MRRSSASRNGCWRNRYPYLILDARYEKVRLDGVIRAQAVLIAIGINWEGWRNVLGVELGVRPAQPAAGGGDAGRPGRGGQDRRPSQGTSLPGGAPGVYRSCEFVRQGERKAAGSPT